jgi:hypothetical protein
MSRGEGAIRGEFGAISRGFNIRWATRLLRETPRADLFSVRAQRSSVGLLGQRQFFSPRKRRWAGARGRKTAAGRTAVRPYTPLPLCGRGGTRDQANCRSPHPAATLWERGNAQQGAPPCAPTPLAHSVGEGLGADKGTSLRFTSRRKTQNFTIYTQHTTPTLHHQRHQPQQQHTRAPTTPVP